MRFLALYMWWDRIRLERLTRSWRVNGFPEESNQRHQVPGTTEMSHFNPMLSTLQMLSLLLSALHHHPTSVPLWNRQTSPHLLYLALGQWGSCSNMETFKQSKKESTLSSSTLKPWYLTQVSALYFHPKHTHTHPHPQPGTASSSPWELSRVPIIVPAYARGNVAKQTRKHPSFWLALYSESFERIRNMRAIK